MEISCVCDKCKNEPISFEVGDDEDFSSAEIAYYHIVPRECKDPAVLMSNGDLVFRVAVVKTHEVSTEFAFLCCTCFNEMFEDDLHFENEEDLDDK